MKTIFSLCIGIFLSLSLSAQINPPDLLCVTTLFNGDVELTWDLPTNTCGSTFNGYRVYISNDPTQPFNLLTIVTNPTQTTYTHTNANGTNVTWYYYLTTDLVCPNETPVQSVTLDNRQPAVTEIDYVTVNDAGNIELHWLQNASPETFGYIILWETTSGFVAIDTVIGRSMTSYEHAGADPTIKRESYTIVAIDQCGNVGLVNDEPHKTILLDASIDRCTREVTLNWTPYTTWTNGVSNHQIWVSTNGGSPEFVDYIGDTTQYIYYDVNDGDQLEFFVAAVKRGTSTRSKTSRVSINVDVVQPMSYIYLSNVSVNADNQVNVSWKWDDNADLSLYDALRSDSSFTFNAFLTENISGGISSTASVLDSTVNPNVQSYDYRIESMDSCGNSVLSNYGSTIHLAGEGRLSFENILYWTPFTIVYGEVEDYTIYKTEDGVETPLETVSFLTTRFEDEIDGYDAAQASACYFVVARARMTYPDGSSETIFSRSNTYCVQQPVRLRVPNAFIPSGESPEFKPVLVFGETANFTMRIFNRWGTMLFESNDPNTGWDGRIDGKAIPQGLYTYQMVVTQTNGDVIEQAGSVMLIR